MPPRTRDELIAMNVMDLEFRKAAEENPLPPSSSDFFERRENRAAHLVKLRKYSPIPGPIPEVAERDVRIPVRDGTEITVRIYSPKKAPEGGSPIIMMYHEGGWSMGDLTDEDLNCRMFSRELGAVCVNVEYRLAPEHKFPIGIHDCWDALKWVASNATLLQGSPERGFIVGGGSAGGNISAVMAHIARDEMFEPPLTGQYLCVPALLPPDVVPENYQSEYLSRYLNKDDPILKGMSLGEGKSVIDEIYQPDHHSPLFAVFTHPDGHKGVPPAFFQVCGMDPLRDEGLVYERVLREEYGIATRLNLYPGHGHYFWTNFPTLAASKKFVSDTLEGVRWLLAQSIKK